MCLSAQAFLLGVCYKLMSNKISRSKSIDRPFLDKLKYGSVYCKDYDEYISSIVNEIYNILSCRLKSSDKVTQNPFCYGIKDLQSLDLSYNNLESFRIQCEKIIEHLEPRVDKVEISNINILKNTQSLEFSIKCIIKKTGSKLIKKLSYGTQVI